MQIIKGIWTVVPPAWRIAAFAIILIALALGARSCTRIEQHKQDTAIGAAKQAGSSETRAAAAEGALADVVQSEKARAAVRDGNGVGRFCLCRKTSRTPGACRPPAGHGEAGLRDDEADQLCRSAARRE